MDNSAVEIVDRAVQRVYAMRREGQSTPAVLNAVDDVLTGGVQWHRFGDRLHRLDVQIIHDDGSVAVDAELSDGRSPNHYIQRVEICTSGRHRFGWKMGNGNWEMTDLPVGVPAGDMGAFHCIWLEAVAKYMGFGTLTIDETNASRDDI